MSALRPLPPRPSLEFEHKEAKALLRRLKAGDPDALARARERHSAIGSSVPIKLADAQVVIAREYGFTSWPKLARYFGDVAGQHNTHRGFTHGRKLHEGMVHTLIAEHRDRRIWTARMLTRYVPRFYGMPLDEVFAFTITEDEARLAMARVEGYASWDELLERAAEDARFHARVWEPSAMDAARAAIAAGDLEALKRVVEAHPSLLEHKDDERGHRNTLLGIALSGEQQRGREALRPIIDWLAIQGFDVQRALNLRLCGLHPADRGITPDKIRSLIARGADPNWVAPNGITVLEHALIRYRNGEAVDVLAEHVTPRRALWISAGLGDVESVGRFLDRAGKPTAAARAFRPDFDAVGHPMGSHPEPDDDEILLEAFLVAMLNGRTAVLEYLVARGAPVNSLTYGTPMICFAVGDIMPAVVECLVRCGVDLDLRGWRPQMSAREIAREHFENAPHEPARRRIAELCGLDTKVILAERNARPIPAPTVLDSFQSALELASDDARRQGRSDVHPENLLFGVLRIRGNGILLFTHHSHVDLERFHAEMKQRIHPADDRIASEALPMRPETRAIIDASIAFATSRRSDVVHEMHLLHALTRDANGAAAALLKRYGGDIAMLNAQLERQTC